MHNVLVINQFNYAQFQIVINFSKKWKFDGREVYFISRVSCGEAKRYLIPAVRFILACSKMNSCKTEDKAFSENNQEQPKHWVIRFWQI